jgi:broad specificity phosphatase PhoE
MTPQALPVTILPPDSRADEVYQTPDSALTAGIASSIFEPGEPMSRLRRILLVRHGETDGESSIRFHGSTDVDLSAEGREQVARAGRQVRLQPIDLVVASPLRRSWRAAWIVGGGAPVRLESDFREVDFGRWEGLTKEEIQIRDPILYDDWQSGVDGFGYPEGESREEFRSRIGHGLERLMAADVHSALLVLHKGVIRVIVEQLTGEALPLGDPLLGGIVTLTRAAEGSWFRG